jgi:hypothetical protein
MTLRIHAPFASVGAGDVLIDGTNVNAIATVLASRFNGSAAPTKPVSSGIYSLMWDLAKCDISGP